VELSRYLYEKGRVWYARLDDGKAGDEQSEREKPPWTGMSQQ
jgi:hypothetical protein